MALVSFFGLIRLVILFAQRLFFGLKVGFGVVVGLIAVFECGFLFGKLLFFGSFVGLNLLAAGLIGLPLVSVQLLLMVFQLADQFLLGAVVEVAPDGDLAAAMVHRGLFLAAESIVALVGTLFEARVVVPPNTKSL